MIIGSALTKVTEEEKQARAALFVMPDSEKNPKDIRATFRWTKLSASVGLIVTVILLVFWVIPYMNGIK